MLSQFLQYSKTEIKKNLKEVSNDSHDPNKVIFSFSYYELSDVEKSVLCEGLNFSLKRKFIEYFEFLLPFKLLFRDVKQENLCSEDLFLIARLLDTALSSFERFSSDRSPSKNLTVSECKALRYLSKNKSIVILKRVIL